MALLGSYEDDDYSPEFGTLMLRDAPVEGHDGWPDPGESSTLVEHATDAQPCGTITRAGYGWLEGAAGDGHHTIVLEHHDSPPARDDDDWDDLVETPYQSGTGAVGLTFVTGAPMDSDLVLAGPGLYRVRVARNRGPDFGDTWRLQFWRTVAPPEPPRWFVRDRPPVAGGDPGWDTVLGYEIQDLRSIVFSATTGGEGVTVEQLAAWCADHHRPVGWLDEPLFSEPRAVLPTGHADLDQARQDQRAAIVAETRQKMAELAGFAAQLDVPAPTTRREMLTFLVAAGVLNLYSARYRVVEDPPRAQDVLDLPADRVAQLELYDATRRYTSFASDIVSTAAWTTSGTVTVAELVNRVLASESDVRAALRYAVSRRLLDVDGDTALTITVLPSQPRSYGGYVQMPQPGPPWNQTETARTLVAVDAPADLSEEDVQTLLSAHQVHERPKPCQPPAGDPPRAGVVTTNGEVVVWRDGEPVVLARLTDSSVYRAWESAYGIVIAGSSAITVVRPDGDQEIVGADLAPHAGLSEDGRHLAVAETHFGRHPRYGLHLVDLADLSRRTMPWEKSRAVSVIAVHGGDVYFHGDNKVMKWTPGSDPVLLGRAVQQIDPISGRALGIEDANGVIITGGDGSRRRIVVDQGAMLVPGGDSLYTFRHLPPAVTVFDFDAINTPRVFWLPAEANLSTSTPSRPVWETMDNLLIPATWQFRFGAQLLRLNIRSGDFEAVTLPSLTNPRIVVEPSHGGQAES